MGLCGTGSKDIVVEDAFVPEYRTHSYLDAFHLRNPGMAVNDAPLYRLPLGLVFLTLAARRRSAPRWGAGAFREQQNRRINIRDQLACRRGSVHPPAPAESAAEIDARATACSAISPG